MGFVERGSMAEERDTGSSREPVEIHPQDIATRLAAYRRRVTPTVTDDVVIDLTAAESDIVQGGVPGGPVVVLRDSEPEHDDDA